MDLAELQREAHAIAVARGGWDTERTFGDLIADVHEKLSDVRKAYLEHGLEHPEFVTVLVDDVPATYRSDALPHGWTLKPHPVAAALADVVIRVADIAEFYGMDLIVPLPLPQRDRMSAYLLARVDGPIEHYTFGENIAVCSAYLTFAWLNRESGNKTPPWIVYLSGAVDHITLMAAHHGIDLDAAIAAKLEYHRTRAQQESAR